MKPSARKVAVRFRKVQYKSICDYAKAFGVEPEHAVVSLSMLGAVNWLIDNGNKYKKFHKKKNIPSVRGKIEAEEIRRQDRGGTHRS